MHRRQKIFLVLALLLLAACLQGGAQKKPATEKEALTTTVVQALEEPNPGKEKYETYCAPCHGATGKGWEEAVYRPEPMAKALVSAEVKEKTDEELKKSIKEGVKGTEMLAWGKVLSDEEIDLVLSYIRDMQKKG